MSEPKPVKIAGKTTFDSPVCGKTLFLITRFGVTTFSAGFVLGADELTLCTF